MNSAEPETLVTAETFDDPVEAEVLRSRLERHGIRADLVGDENTEVEAAGVWAVRVRLLVPRDQVERAREVLRSRSGGSIADRAVYAALLGLALPPVQLYSLYLVARLLPRWRDLPAQDRRRARHAALLALWFPFVVAAFALCL